MCLIRNKFIIGVALLAGLSACGVEVHSYETSRPIEKVRLTIETLNYFDEFELIVDECIAPYQKFEDEGVIDIIDKFNSNALSIEWLSTAARLNILIFSDYELVSDNSYAKGYFLGGGQVEYAIQDGFHHDYIITLNGNC